MRKCATEQRSRPESRIAMFVYLWRHGFPRRNTVPVNYDEIGRACSQKLG